MMFVDFGALVPDGYSGEVRCRVSGGDLASGPDSALASGDMLRQSSPFSRHVS